MGPLPRLIVPVLFLLAACRSFEVQRQQVFLRYQPEEDVLDAVLVYEGVGATKEEHVESTMATVAAIARGRRHIMIFDWMFDFDLEAMLERLRSETIDPEDEHGRSKQAFREYEPNISVIEARFLLEEGRAGEDGESEVGGCLCLLQRLRFEHASRLLHLLDLFVNEALLEEMGEGDGHEISGDPGTDALLFARAKRGGSWSRFDGAVLEVSVPMTPELAALQLEELVAGAASSPENGKVLAQFLAALSALQVTGDELSLRFAPAEDGWIRFKLADERREYHPGVAERLGRDGLAAAGDLEAEIQRLKSKP